MYMRREGVKRIEEELAWLQRSSCARVHHGEIVHHNGRPDAREICPPAQTQLRSVSAEGMRLGAFGAALHRAAAKLWARTESETACEMVDCPFEDGRPRNENEVEIQEKG